MVYGVGRAEPFYGPCSLFLEKSLVRPFVSPCLCFDVRSPLIFPPPSKEGEALHNARRGGAGFQSRTPCTPLFLLLLAALVMAGVFGFLSVDDSVAFHSCHASLHLFLFIA